MAVRRTTRTTSDRWSGSRDAGNAGASSAPLEQRISGFWDAHPCGDAFVGGLADAYGDDYVRFFEDYDRHRYATESHVLACLDRLRVQGTRLLEIGLGEGAESEQLLRRGARWTGVDITDESVRRVRRRLILRGLPAMALLRASATALPFADSSFDAVFSHGVLHHVPDIAAAQRELHRVLRPDGRLVVMLYARHSLNYWFSIAVLRRLALVAAWALRRGPLRNVPVGALLEAHLDNVHREGLSRYLRLGRFLHASTDGPRNPYSQVYDLRRVRRDFPLFSVVWARKYFMHAPPLPVHRLPGSRLVGWHLWVELRPL